MERLSGPGAIVALSDDGDTLSLGGMYLVNHHGDIDIYLPENSTILPSLRLQRADIPDIIDFLKQAR